MKTASLHPQADGKEALARISRKLNFLLKHNGSGNINAIADANDIVFYFNSWECN